MQNKFTQDELSRYSKELENAASKANDLLSLYLKVLENDDGMFIRDEKLLPATKEALKNAIIVVAIASEDTPQVNTVVEKLLNAWTALEFFGSPSKAPTDDSLPLYSIRQDIAGNSLASTAIGEYIHDWISIANNDRSSEISLKWQQKIHSAWRMRISSGDSRIDSLLYFTDGTVPEKFSKGLKAMASSSDQQNTKTTSGCAALIVLAVIMPSSIYAIFNLCR
jgi:hypothetical protein